MKIWLTQHKTKCLHLYDVNGLPNHSYEDRIPLVIEHYDENISTFSVYERMNTVYLGIPIFNYQQSLKFKRDFPRDCFVLNYKSFKSLNCFIR